MASAILPLCGAALLRPSARASSARPFRSSCTAPKAAHRPHRAGGRLAARASAEKTDTQQLAETAALDQLIDTLLVRRGAAPRTTAGLRGAYWQRAAPPVQRSALATERRAWASTRHPHPCLCAALAPCPAPQAAKDSNELAKLVANNIMSYDQRFWLRLATRSDTAGSEEERQQLGALAKVGARRCVALRCYAVAQLRANEHR